MSKTSPTQRTLKELRAHGWTVAVVERWNQYARIRQDLFGFIDLIAIHPGRGVLGVQATSDSNFTARCKKSEAADVFKTWLQSGARFAVVGWKKEKNGRWRPRWREFTLEGCEDGHCMPIRSAIAELESKVEGIDATYEDEEVAHLETLNMLKVAQAENAKLRAVAEAGKYVNRWLTHSSLCDLFDFHPGIQHESKPCNCGYSAFEAYLSALDSETRDVK